jgi:DNA polymerase-3 subunit epsilon
MTRGQNTLSMDMEADDASGGGQLLEAGPLGEILVLAAAADELAEHDNVLAALDKGVKGECVWRKYSPQG